MIWNKRRVLIKYLNHILVQNINLRYRNRTLYDRRDNIKHLNGEIFVENKEFIYEGKNYKGALFRIILVSQ